MTTGFQKVYYLEITLLQVSYGDNGNDDNDFQCGISRAGCSWWNIEPAEPSTMTGTYKV